MSGGKYLIGTFMYSDSFIGEARKKSFKSQLINLAPFFASDMVMLIHNLVSTRLDAGDPASSSYLSLSLPATKRTLRGLVLRVQ